MSIRSCTGKNRKARADADASYFDPDQCELVIRFVPIDTAEHDAEQRAESEPGTDGETERFDFETATSQLVDALAKAESTRPFVGLKWFRDQFLSACGHGWPADSRISGALLRQATDQRLPAVDADRILKQIEEDAASSFLVQPSTAAVVEDAARLIDRHPLKAYDALQLAGRLMARRGTPAPVTFVCADTRLCDAARVEGLTVLNPISP